MEDQAELEANTLLPPELGDYENDRKHTVRQQGNWRIAVVGSLTLLALIGGIALVAGFNNSAKNRPVGNAVVETKGILMLEESENVLCDDFTPLLENGCCSTNKCPSSCGSKSVSESNGNTKCQCQHCSAPPDDEEACTVDDDDDDDRRRLHGTNPTATATGGRAVKNISKRAMRAISKQAKFMNCMIGRLIKRGQAKLQADLNLTAKNAKGLELLGLLSSGALANATTSKQGTAARKLWGIPNIAGPLTAVGSFVQHQTQAAASTVTGFANSLNMANMAKYYCLLLMPMCNCDDPQNRPPSFVGGNFQAYCVLGPPFSSTSAKPYHQTFDSASLKGTIHSDDLQLNAGFGLTMFGDGHYTLQTKNVIKGNLSVDMKVNAKTKVKKLFFLPGANKTSCFLVDDFPMCLSLMLVIGAELEVMGNVQGDIKGTFDVDAAFDASFNVPFPLGAVSAAISKNHGRFHEMLDVKVQMKGNVKLTLAPELTFVPLPGLPVGVGTYASAEMIGSAHLDSTVNMNQSETGGKLAPSTVTGGLTDVTGGVGGVGFNMLWQSEATAATFPKMTLDIVNGSFFTVLSEMLDDSINELQQRILQYVPAAVQTVVKTFLQVLVDGAKSVIGNLFARLRATLPLLDHLSKGWRYKPPPHMCSDKGWGAYESRAKIACPVRAR